ncbi:MAG: universal stress protein [Nitrospirae bacterium]|nr:universal stress protein [Nitrospirota bacterium]
MKILSAIDGSDAAFNAFSSACKIAQKTYSYITVFYVNKGEEYTTEETGWISIREKISNELESKGQEVIQKAYDIAKAHDVSMEGILSYGVPATEILKYVKAHGIIKLIAMGHSSKGKSAQEFVESTTKSVVVQSRTPVFVTSSSVDIRRILIAVDNSEVSKKAVAFGGRFAKSLEAEIGIVSFIPDTEAIISEYKLIAEVPNIERHIDSSEKALKEIMEQAVSTAKDVLNSLDVKASSIIKRGRSDEIILEAKNYDLLIAGVKSKPGRLTNKLLDSHDINAIFVQ